MEHYVFLSILCFDRLGLSVLELANELAARHLGEVGA